MKIKKFILPVLLVCLLFAINCYLFNSTNGLSIINDGFITKDVQVSPEKKVEKVWQAVNREYYDKEFNGQDWKRWKKHYKNKIKTTDDAEVAINTMLASLNEPYTRYLNNEEYSELTTSIASRIYGIGVNIYSDAGTIKVFNVLPSTPAQENGIKVGDIVLTVDDKNTSGLDISEVANMVRGEENTTVTLLIQRGGQKITKKIIRKEIKIKNVESKILNNKIGYIQIINFIGKTVPAEFNEAIQKTAKTESLIIDLRGNTGGLLENAVYTTNVFVNQGNITEIIYRNSKRSDIKASRSKQVIKKPIVILINGATASASEIFAGALKDNNKAILIGKKTYGKGLVQKVIPLPEKTAMNVTIAKYLTPNGTDINKQGIKPDIEVGKVYDFYPNTKNDEQLNAAIKYLNKISR